MKLCSKAISAQRRFDLLEAILSGKSDAEVGAAYAFNKFEADELAYAEYERLRDGIPTQAEMDCSTCCCSDSMYDTDSQYELDAASETARD